MWFLANKSTGVVALLVLMAFAQTEVLAQGRAAGVLVDKIIVEPLSQTMPVIGRFVAKENGPVAALVSGPVADVTVSVGDRVKKGDVLAQLDTDRLKWNRQLRASVVKEREAEVKTAKAQLTMTQNELDRLASLRKSAAFPRARFDDKQNEVAKFQSEVFVKETSISRAQAELRLADIDLKNSLVKAPFNGVVVMKHTSPGAYLSVGDTVVTIVNDEKLEVEAEIPSDRIAGLTVGRKITGALDTGEALALTVRAIVPQENARTRTRPVRFEVSGMENKGLATDQTVTVNLPIGEIRQVTSIHKDAVTSRGGQNFVFVAMDGKAEQRTVQIGEAVGNRFEVLGGVAEGDIVVTRGNERLRPGQAIRYEGMKPVPNKPEGGGANAGAKKES